MLSRRLFPAMFIPTVAFLAGAEAARGEPSSQSRIERPALVFLIAGQSNAGGVAAFSPETNEKSGMAAKHPTIAGSTAKEVGIPTTRDAYPRTHIWKPGKPGRFERLAPGENLLGGYRDPWRHGIELPMAMLLEAKYPQAGKFIIKYGPPGHNLHTQWAAGRGADYREFMTPCNGAMADLKQRYEKVRVIGLYWDQGESDRPKAQEYGTNLRALFAAFRKDTGITDLQIFVRKHLFQHGDESFTPIIRAQIAVAGEDPNVHLLDLDLGSNEKNFKAWAWTDNNGHLSSKAFLELAKRILVKAAVPGGADTDRRHGHVHRPILRRPSATGRLSSILSALTTCQASRSGKRQTPTTTSTSGQTSRLPS